MAQASPLKTPVGAPPVRPRRRARRRPSANVILFTLPALVLMTVFLVWPVVQNFRYSLTNWNGISASTYVGLTNFRELFSDTLFRGVIKHTLQLAVFGTAASVAVGVLWAHGI